MTLRDAWRWLKIDRFNRDILKTCLSLLFNVSYAVFNLILAWIYQSEWYLIMAAFFAPLCIIRFRILIFWKKDRAAQDGHGILFFSGIILLLLDMQIAAIVYVSSIRQVTKGHGEIIMITVAAYTFTKLGFAIARAVNARKDSRPLSKTIRCITYAELAASLLSLQRSMIVSFGNENHEWALLMNIICGSTVCLFIAATGISMILYGGLMKSKIVEANEKIAEDVTTGFQKIQNGVVNGYKKIENGVVEGFTKIEDSFISRYLQREGESIEEAKERLKREEQEIRNK